MTEAVNNKADPKETRNALALWHGFTRIAVWCVVAVAVVLLLMLAFLY